MGPKRESRKVNAGDRSGEAREVSRARCRPQTLNLFTGHRFLYRCFQWESRVTHRGTRGSGREASPGPACCSIRAPEDSTVPAVPHPCSHLPSERPVLHSTGASHPTGPSGWTAGPQSPRLGHWPEGHAPQSGHRSPEGPHTAPWMRPYLSVGAGRQDRDGLIHRGQQRPQGQADFLTDKRPHQH